MHRKLNTLREPPIGIISGVCEQRHPICRSLGPAIPAAEAAFRPLIRCSESCHSHMSSSPDICLFLSHAPVSHQMGGQGLRKPLGRGRHYRRRRADQAPPSARFGRILIGGVPKWGSPDLALVNCVYGNTSTVVFLNFLERCLIRRPPFRNPPMRILPADAARKYQKPSVMNRGFEQTHLEMI